MAQIACACAGASNHCEQTQPHTPDTCCKLKLLKHQLFDVSYADAAPSAKWWLIKSIAYPACQVNQVKSQLNAAGWSKVTVGPPALHAVHRTQPVQLYTHPLPTTCQHSAAGGPVGHGQHQSKKPATRDAAAAHAPPLPQPTTEGAELQPPRQAGKQRVAHSLVTGC